MQQVGFFFFYLQFQTFLFVKGGFIGSRIMSDAVASTRTLAVPQILLTPSGSQLPSPLVLIYPGAADVSVTKVRKPLLFPGSSSPH